MTPSERIRHIIKSKHLTIEAFAEKTGVPRSTLNQMFKNDSNPKLPLLEACLELFPDLNPRWLITGKGEPWDMTETPQLEALKNKLKEMDDFMHNIVLKMEQQVEESMINITERIEKLEQLKKDN